jgi:starch synthase
MRITHIASEMTPIAKVGGLADVIHGLSKELIRLGHEIEVILPKYDCIDSKGLSQLRIEVPELWHDARDCRFKSTVFSAYVDGIKVYLIDMHHPEQLFNRGVIYGCHDDLARFVLFSEVALHFLAQKESGPDLIHLHDWPTAIIAGLCKEGMRPEDTKGVVLTLHNMQHQGKCALEELLYCNLKLSTSTLCQFQDNDGMNLLKGGIECADHVTTVSPHYEKEIQSEPGAFGLHETVMKNASKIRGILNGIDTTFWDPAHDTYLNCRYDARQVDLSRMDSVVKWKRANRQQLSKQLGLCYEETPLVAAVARLVPQKSPQLLIHALRRTLEKGGQFVLLGSSPIPEIREEFEALQKECRAGDRARILMQKDEGLAHKIFAAADIFLIPSLFEPCGLTQLIALRYGTVPVARLTGGLVDTVFDVETASVPPEARNGFTFDFPDAAGLDWALLRALECCQNQREKWKQLMLQGMRCDFSWQKTAPLYVELYGELLQKPSALRM